MKLLALPLIWLGLLLVVLAGFVVGLPCLVLAPSYGARIFRMYNRTAAAVFGWSGEHGVSHECGKSGCVFCRLLCRALGWMLGDPEHCEREAKQ